MAEGDGAAVDIELRLVDAELLGNGEDLAGEGLVDLDQIDVVQGEAGALQRDLRGRNRADAHDVRIAAGDAPGDDAAEGLLVSGVFGGSDGDHGGAVDDAAGVAGGDEAV